jgi:hypothetical protein
MSQKLVDFLKSLAADPKKVERVREHFDRETKDAGLDKEEIKAIRMGDAAEIRRLAGGTLPGNVDSQVSVCIQGC